MQEAEAGSLDLYALDESGFLPTWPTSYTWARQGARARVPYQASEGRRVNAIGAVAPRGPQPRLVWRSSPGKLDSAVFLDFLWRDVAGLPAPPDELPAGYCRSRPCVVVLDNYSVHKSRVVKAARPQLEAAGVSCTSCHPTPRNLTPWNWCGVTPSTKRRPSEATRISTLCTLPWTKPSPPTPNTCPILRGTYVRLLSHLVGV